LCKVLPSRSHVSGGGAAGTKEPDPLVAPALTCDSGRSCRSASAVVMANMDLRKSWVTEFCMRLVNGTVPEHEW